jgi:hypothetical protein
LADVPPGIGSLRSAVYLPHSGADGLEKVPKHVKLRLKRAALWALVPIVIGVEADVF